MGSYRNPSDLQASINAKMRATNEAFKAMAKIPEQFLNARINKAAKQKELLNKRKSSASTSFGKSWSEINDELGQFNQQFTDKDKGSATSEKLNNMVMSWGQEIDAFIDQNPNASQAQINMVIQKNIQKVNNLGKDLSHLYNAKKEFDEFSGLEYNEENAILRDGKDADLLMVLDDLDNIEVGTDENGNSYYGLNLDAEDPNERILLNGTKLRLDAEKGTAYFSKAKKFDPDPLKNTITGLIQTKEGADPRFANKVDDTTYYDKEALKEFIKTDPNASTILEPYLKQNRRFGEFQYMSSDKDAEYSNEAYTDMIIDRALQTLPDKRVKPGSNQNTGNDKKEPQAPTTTSDFVGRIFTEFSRKQNPSTPGVVNKNPNFQNEQYIKDEVLTYLKDGNPGGSYISGKELNPNSPDTHGIIYYKAAKNKDYEPLVGIDFTSPASVENYLQNVVTDDAERLIAKYS